MTAEYCRLCLDIIVNDKLFIPMDEEFVQAYNMLTNLNVHLNDGLSQLVCDACRDIVKSFLDFKNKCVCNEHYQSKLLEESRVFEECSLTEELEEDFKFSVSIKEDSYCNLPLPDAFDNKCYVKDISNASVNETCFDELSDEDHESNNGKKTELATKRISRKSKTKVDKKKETKIKKEKVKTEMEDSKLLCGLCTLTLDNTTELSKHLETHKSTLYCQICQEMQSRWYRALAHRSLHISVKKMNCYVCDKLLSSVNSLAKHYHRVHKLTIPSDLQCKLCLHTFKSARYLGRHEKAFHSGNIYICDYCSKTVKTKALMQSHLKTHSDLKPVKCELCDFTCKRYQNLKAHRLRRHSSVKIQCQMCDSLFENEEKKKKHKCSEHNMCPICGKIVNYNLSRHVRNHGSNDRNFSCDRCPSAFKTKRGLVEHISRHEGIKRYSCQYCPLSFYTQAPLIKHRRTHTGERPYVCVKCGKAFVTNYNLKVHMQVHGEYLVKKRNTEQPKREA